MQKSPAHHTGCHQNTWRITCTTHRLLLDHLKNHMYNTHCHIAPGKSLFPKYRLLNNASATSKPIHFVDVVQTLAYRTKKFMFCLPSVTETLTGRRGTGKNYNCYYYLLLAPTQHTLQHVLRLTDTTVEIFRCYH